MRFKREILEMAVMGIRQYLSQQWHFNVVILEKINE